MKYFLFKIAYCTLYVLLVSSVFGQKAELQDRIFPKERHNRIFLHNQGWGVGHKRIQRIDRHWSTYNTFELFTLHHPKEESVETIGSQQGDGHTLTYGKKSDVYIVSYGKGVRKKMFHKKRENAVEISFNYEVGAGVVLSKHRYIRTCVHRSIYERTEEKSYVHCLGIRPDSVTILTERYNEDKHTNPHLIYSGVRFFDSRFSATLTPQVYATMEANFDFSKIDKVALVVSIGLKVQYFPLSLTIMANNSAYWVLFSPHIAFSYGLKYNKYRDVIEKTETKVKKKPNWLRVKLPTGENYKTVRKMVEEHKLHTICESGNCPNMGECWGAGTATFMILGNICTRSCQFCAVNTGKPEEVDVFEPARVAKSIKLMNIKHCVLTSVDRDDLPDGGAEIWAMTVRAVRKQSPQTTVETLIPDFAGNWENLQRIIDVKPEVVSHNMETVREITKQVRIQAKYDRSLELLRRLKKAGMTTKSGIMLGLGETYEQVLYTMDDLVQVGVDILTLGQYLQPTPKHLPVQEFISPEQFEEYKQIGLKKGFRYVESGPLVRSSYHAEKHILPKS